MTLEQAHILQMLTIIGRGITIQMGLTMAAHPSSSRGRVLGDIEAKRGMASRSSQRS